MSVGKTFYLFHHGTPGFSDGEAAELYVNVSVELDLAKDLLLATFSTLWDVNLSEIEIYTKEELDKAPRCSSCGLIVHPPNDECNSG